MKNIPQYWSESLAWLAYNLFGIAFPVLVSIIALAAMKRVLSVGAITQGGQFATYSAAMSIATVYLVAKPDPKRLPFTHPFCLASFAVFGVAVTFFFLAVLYANGVNIAGWIIEWPSVILFIVCAIITFLAVLFDNRRAEINRRELMGSRESAQKQLGESFGMTEQNRGVRS
jgi:hypothetical protein